MKKIKYYFLLLPLAINAEIKLLDRIAVIVDDGVIMESQIKSQTAEILEQYKNQNINPPSKEILREEIIEKLVLDELQLQMATRVGIRISDAELNEIRAFRVREGRFWRNLCCGTSCGYYLWMYELTAHIVATCTRRSRDPAGASICNWSRAIATTRARSAIGSSPISADLKI